MSGGLFCVVTSKAEYTMSAGYRSSGAGSSTRRALLPLDCCLVVTGSGFFGWGCHSRVCGWLHLLASCKSPFRGGAWCDVLSRVGGKVRQNRWHLSADVPQSVL